MILYQMQTLAGVDIGDPGPLPAELVGLSDESLADLSWVDPARGFADRRFVPIDVPDPEPEPEPVRVTKIGFSRLFTQAERLAMLALRKQIGELTAEALVDPANLALAQAAAMFESFDLPAEFIELDHPDTIAAVGALLVGLGVLTEARAEAVLANTPPAG